MTLRFRHKFESYCPDAVEHVDRMEMEGPRPDYVHDDGRCSGLVICEVCGFQYYDHPRHPFVECLTVTCEGKIFKL